MTQNSTFGSKQAFATALICSQLTEIQPVQHTLFNNCLGHNLLSISPSCWLYPPSLEYPH